MTDQSAPDHPSGIPGERGVALVARTVSLQAKAQNAFAIGVLLLLGGGFLTWYYLGLAESHDEAARRKPPAVQGEMLLPPLAPGPAKVRPADDPAATSALVDADSEAGRALLAAPVATPDAGMVSSGSAMPAVDPVAQRQIMAPVLVRGSGAYAPRTTDVEAEVFSEEAAPAVLPNGGRAGSGLGELLRPTVIEAAVAGVLPDRRFLLPKGAFVDCTLETAIDSTLAGMTTCVTATDVWSADGATVLLERGTKLVGETRGGVRQGQRRLFVLWSEARTPNGVTVELASPGTDALGRAGVTGAVDTHFAARFGAAILISIIDAGTAALVAAQSDGGSSVVITPSGASDVVSEVLRQTVDIPPTIRVAQGARMQVLVARDVSFAQVYRYARR
jgi:type IV secretion system protein VirB10